MAALSALSTLASGVTHVFCFPSPQRVLSQDREDSVGEHFNIIAILLHSSLVVQMVQNLPTMWETWVRSLGSFPREGNGNPLQYPCQENSKDR